MVTPGQTGRAHLPCQGRQRRASEGGGNGMGRGERALGVENMGPGRGSVPDSPCDLRKPLPLPGPQRPISKAPAPEGLAGPAPHPGSSGTGCGRVQPAFFGEGARCPLCRMFSTSGLCPRACPPSPHSVQLPQVAPGLAPWPPGRGGAWWEARPWVHGHSQPGGRGATPSPDGRTRTPSPSDEPAATPAPPPPLSELE